MHIKEFLQKSDELIEKMSAQQMKHCLTEIARKTGDNVREEFLQILNDGFVELSSNQTKSLTNSENKLSRFMSDEKVMEKIYFFEETFRKIEEGDLLFCANEYETDYDYHWDSDWEISHSDPEGIGRIIEDAADFAYECVNDLRYKQALVLFDLILELNPLSYCEESGEDFEIGLQEMIDEGLVALNMNKLAVNTLYAKYQSTSKNKRAEELYEYFSYPCFKNIHVEDIVSTGREKVKDFDGFLHQWIKLLLDKTGEVATRLLKEAIINYKGNEGLIQFAREKQGLRPSLYLESINELEKSTEYEKITEIGIEALEKINPILKIRSKIALKTAQASFFAGKPELMHQCWYQAFVSDTTVPNFLRLFVNEKVAADYKETALEKLEKLECLSKTASSFSYKKAGDYFENEENAVDEITYKTLHFLKVILKKQKYGAMSRKILWAGPENSYGTQSGLCCCYFLTAKIKEEPSEKFRQNFLIERGSVIPQIFCFLVKK